MSEDITPEESVAPVYLVPTEPEEVELFTLGDLEAQRLADREAAVGKLRLLGASRTRRSPQSSRNKEKI